MSSVAAMMHELLCLPLTSSSAAQQALPSTHSRFAAWSSRFIIAAELSKSVPALPWVKYCFVPSGLHHAATHDA
jgi:hypothetical protein